MGKLSDIVNIFRSGEFGATNGHLLFGKDRFELSVRNYRGRNDMTPIITSIFKMESTPGGDIKVDEGINFTPSGGVKFYLEDANTGVEGAPKPKKPAEFVENALIQAASKLVESNDDFPESEEIVAKNKDNVKDLADAWKKQKHPKGFLPEDYLAVAIASAKDGAIGEFAAVWMTAASLVDSYRTIKDWVFEIISYFEQGAPRDLIEEIAANLIQGFWGHLINSETDFPKGSMKPYRGSFEDWCGLIGAFARANTGGSILEVILKINTLLIKYGEEKAKEV
jgi:hypothetical protein